MKAQLISTGILLVLFFNVSGQNVGIGTTAPLDAKLEIIAPSGNQLVARTDDAGTGISASVINGNPTIGFNGMGMLSSYGYLGAGYGGFFQFIPANGSLNYFNSAASGAANSSLTASSALLTIDKTGALGLGLATPQEGIHLKEKNIRLDNSAGTKTVLIANSDVNNNGGEIRLFSNSATDSTIIIKGSASAGRGGEILFVNPSTGTRTMQISGDFNASGRSRIVIDELQIKGGADFAEYFDISPIENISPLPGMLVSIDEHNTGKLIISNTAYDKKVAGVISGANGINPGMMMGHKNTIADGEFPVAISGRLYLMADANTNAIHPGDLLTTSSIPGYAMKATNKKKTNGAVIGKAMSSLETGKGMVLVLIGIR